MQIEFKLMDDKTALVDVEEWRQIQEFLRYEVSTLGRVRNRTTLKILAGAPHESGYRQLTMFKDGKAVTRLIHRLVANTFLEPPSSNHIQVNHINKDRSDNRLSNLEWATRSHNCKHSKTKL